MKRKILSMALALVMLVTLMPMSAKAEDNENTVTLPTPVEWDRSKSKTATNLDVNYESDVTLALPAKDYKPIFDVVFVVDCTSVLLTSGITMINQLEAMADELLAKNNVRLNVGVIGFGNQTREFFKLQEITQENNKQLMNEARALMGSSEVKEWIIGNGGTNIQRAIKAGNLMLDNSESGSRVNDRYLVLMTDGGTFWYDNEKGESSCTVCNSDGNVLNMGNMDANLDCGGWERINDSKYLQAKKAGKDFDDFIR